MPRTRFQPTLPKACHGKALSSFFYIARESLSRAQYFIHLARRLGYLSDMDLPAERTKRKFAYLHGLIRSAAKEEVWKITKIVASVGSLLVLSVLSTRKGPVVSAPVVL